MSVRSVGTLGVLWRGDPLSRGRVTREESRLRRVFEALDAVGIDTKPIVYADELVGEIHEELLPLDGVLVWVNPIQDGQDRSRLDPLLREVAAEGVWVSTHPDVILQMGTKEVLFRTRDLGWGTDTHLYRSARELAEELPARLAAGARVLKQNRGNGGRGVWKVERLRDDRVQILHAERGSREEELTVSELVERCAPCFDHAGLMIDQPFQPRLPDGMIRCYVSHDEVVGFAHQFIRALMPTPPAGSPSEAFEPGPRLMYGAAEPRFAPLRTRMESDWIPALQARLGIERASLPVLWDADFLYGPADESGADTFVLCEINVSSVFPFPDQALEKLARSALIGAVRARSLRSARAQSCA